MKQRILVLTSRSPYPLIAGYKMRIHYISKLLSRRYDVDLLCLQPVKTEPPHLSPFKQIFTFPMSVAKLGFHAIHHWVKGWPLQVGGYFDYKVSRWLKEHAGNYDLIYVHHVRMAPYAMELERYRILDYHDAISMHYQMAASYANGFWKTFYLLEKKRLLSYELEMLKKFDKAFIVSSVDKEYLLTNLRSNNPASIHCPIAVIPMGVKEEVIVRNPNTQLEENRIVFLGKMDYYPNEDAVIYFAKEIFPLVKEKIKDLEFIIVGAYPTKRVLQLEEIKGVKVTGFVEDPYAYIEKAKVVVAPLRFGAGIQNKILEAMALRKAVVTTSVGAQGIEGEDGRHFIVVSKHEEMAEKVSEIFHDNGRRKIIGENARALIEEKYTWDVIGQKLLREIEEII